VRPIQAQRKERISVAQIDNVTHQYDNGSSSVSNNGDLHGKPSSRKHSAYANANAVSGVEKSDNPGVDFPEIAASNPTQNGNANTNGANSSQSTATDDNEVRLPTFADPSRVSHGQETQSDWGPNGRSQSYVAQWAAVDNQLENHLANGDTDAGVGNGAPILAGMNGFLGSSAPAAQDQLSLSAGAGVGLTTFQGLKEGLKKVA
jgi:hypothetical protein